MRCEGLVIGHGKRPLLPAIDLTLQPGKFLAVVGRNGSGKSTWLRTMLGLLRPLAGHVIRSPGARLGYMPQAITLDPLLPVRAIDLVGWGAHDSWSFLGKKSPRATHLGSEKALQTVGASALGGALFRDLSEGQKQRVLLARVVARGAQVAFLDEPTAAMDAVAEREALACLQSLGRDQGMTVVVVSHFLGMVSRFADQVLFFDREGGHAVTGTPAEIFAHPSFRKQYGSLDHEHAR